MRVLLTGATGFVGSHLASQLISAGHEVTALIRSPQRAVDLKAKGARLIAGDLADERAIAEASEGQQIVYHVAALTGAVDEAEFMAANRDGTARILKAAEQSGIERMILVSSGAAGGPAALGLPRQDGGDQDAPVTMYGRSKLAAEAVVRAGAVPYTIIRPPAVYGPGDTANFLTIFKTLKRTGVAPVFGDGSQELSLVHVADLASACMAAAASPAAIEKTYYVNHPEVVTSLELVRMIGQQLGRTPTIVRLPESITRMILAVTGGWATIFRRRTILRSDKANEFYQPAWTGDPTRFIAETGWQARFDLHEGLADTEMWYRSEGLI